MSEIADVLQIGARNMQNFDLLREVGGCEHPVLLKRGMCATLPELLCAAEYIVSGGNKQVMLCERGIRAGDDEFYRNVLDLNAVVAMKAESYLPCIVDPSHGTGVRDMVIPMSLAALCAGADGVIVEVHNNPTKALCDGAQSLTLEMFEELMRQLKRVARAVGRTI